MTGCINKICCREYFSITATFLSIIFFLSCTSPLLAEENMSSPISTEKKEIQRDLHGGLTVNKKQKISDKDFLHFCSIGADKKILEAIPFGVNFSATTDRGFSCLECATQYGHQKVVDLLLQHKNEIPQQSIALSFIISVLYEYEDIVRLFLDNHIDPNIKTKLGITPLAMAVDENRLGIAELLLKNGAEPDRTDDDGFTPLMISKSREMTACLISAGADPDKKAKNGQTALMLAQSLEIMRLLLTAGANIELKDHFGRNVLMYAVEKNNLEAVALLLEEGADVTAKDNSGTTALMRLGDYKIVAAILQYPQDINVVNHSGASALGIAAFNARSDLIPLLLSRGAGINVGGNSAHTPLSLAITALQKETKISQQNELVNIINLFIRKKAVLSEENKTTIKGLNPNLRKMIIL